MNKQVSLFVQAVFVAGALLALSLSSWVSSARAQGIGNPPRSAGVLSAHQAPSAAGFRSLR